MISEDRSASVCGPCFYRKRDYYPWERGAELRNVQVSHQRNSETVREHQVGGYGIHYHSVRHGTVNECQHDDVNAQGRDTQTNRQRLQDIRLQTI